MFFSPVGPGLNTHPPLLSRVPSPENYVWFVISPKEARKQSESLPAFSTRTEKDGGRMVFPTLQWARIKSSMAKSCLSSTHNVRGTYIHHASEKKRKNRATSLLVRNRTKPFSLSQTQQQVKSRPDKSICI